MADFIVERRNHFAWLTRWTVNEESKRQQAQHLKEWTLENRQHRATVLSGLAMRLISLADETSYQ